jgi:nitroimidazol reductase NimA-like FMN-containing flavoprotein (pyridoxamine 5'-phosphate oxidase superfamily)
MTYDRNGLEVLSRDECLLLLADAHLGRVALSVGALPVVLPVNYTLMDGDIVVSTVSGSKMDAALANAVVAFEIDGADPFYHQGWSVLVRGMARLITDPDELARAATLHLRPWASPTASHYVRIRSEVVSGRRIARDREVIRSAAERAT